MNLKETELQTEHIPAAKPIIGEEERAAVNRVMMSGMIAQGPEVKAFEEEFSTEVLDGRQAVAVNSGTSGLHLGLLAAGIGPGDEVIVPAFTFAATANAVALTGATPVFADINPDTYCLDYDSAESVITDRTRAIMPVHLYGHPADMTALSALAERYNLDIFEDAAQAHSASWSGKSVGTFGTFAVFSLYPTKNMTSGEGGMVATADDDVARILRLLRNQGMDKQYHNEVVGFNNRMTDIHAAIGRAQLPKLSRWTKQRRINAGFFDANLTGVVIPRVRAEATHAYHQYTVRLKGAATDERNRFVDALREEYNIGAGVYYPVPVNELPSFDVQADLPNTKSASREVFSLPIHPSLTQAELDRIVFAVNKLTGAGA